MKDAALRVPITCPECAQESLSEFPIAAIADALVTGDTIRLFASCHDKVWNASFIEREQLREYLDASQIAGPYRRRHFSNKAV
jgi:hypothetical protein